MIKSKYIRLGIVGAVLIYFIIKVVVESSHAACGVLEEFVDYKFNGVIINKYIDSVNHSTKTVIIKNFDSPNPDTFLLLDWDTTNFYYKINKNDTIIKDRGTNRIYVKNETSTLSYTLDFGCAKKK